MKNKSLFTALSFGLGLAFASTAITPAVASIQEGEKSNESMKKHKFMKKGDMSEADMKAMMAKCKGNMVKEETVEKGDDGKEHKKVFVKCMMKGDAGKDGKHKMHMMKRAEGKPTDTVNGFHAALAAGDGDKVLSYLDEDVIIYEGGHINPSKKNYEDTHLQGDMKGSKPNPDRTTTTLEQNVTMSPMTATVMTSKETKGKRDGKAYTRIGTETMVLSATSGKWLITHIHWSFSRPKFEK